MKNNRNTIWNAAYNVYFKIHFHLNTKTKHDAAVTWLNILLIRRTTLSNPSINQSKHDCMYYMIILHTYRYDLLVSITSTRFYVLIEL